MMFGVCLPQYGREVSLGDLRAVATDAEAMGFDSVWASDHVVTPEHLHNSIGPIFLDVFTVLSHVSALTTRVKLGTTVLVTPYRNPLVAAKTISTLDSLSSGARDSWCGSGRRSRRIRRVGDSRVPAGRAHGRISVSDD